MVIGISQRLPWQPGAWYYLAVQEATNSHDFNRKGDVHEHWTKLTADPDWTKYQ